MVRLSPKSFSFLILPVALVAGFIAWQMLSPREAGAQGGMPPPPPVTIMTVERQPVDIWHFYSARLEAVDHAEIRPRVTGTITDVKFEDGQRVEKGDVLFVIDPRPFRAALGQANASVVAAQTAYQLASQELDRAEKLIESGAISQGLYDQRVNGYNTAKAALDGARATAARARLDVEYANIKAPISGRTGEVELTVGNLVETNAGAPLLTTIVSDDGIYADFEVDEQVYLQLAQNYGRDRESENQIPVRLYLDEDEKPEYEGTLFTFDNQLNATSGTMRARAKFANEDGVLVPGMFVRAGIRAADQGPQILIPARAVGTDQDRKFVYVVNDQNMTEYRPVTLGATVNGSVLATSGLAGGERIITEGIVRIRPGMPVNPGDAPQDAPPQLQDPMQDQIQEQPQDIEEEESLLDTLLPDDMMLEESE